MQAIRKISGVSPLRIAMMVLCLAAPARAADDSREPTPRNPEEKTFVLDQMRLFVDTIQTVTEKLAAGDNPGAAEAAAQRGKKAAAVMWKPATIAARETPAWKQMMGATRAGFDTVAESAASGAPLQATLVHLGDMMKGCVACHQLYRVVDATD